MAVKAIFICIWFAVIPFGLGILLTGFRKKEEEGFWITMVSGYAIYFALFELVSLPLIFLKAPFSWLKYGFGGLAAFIALASYLLHYKELWRLTGKRIPKLREIPVVFYLAAILIGIQIGYYVFGMATDLDDAFYVASAGTAIETNGMFTFSAYTGMASKALPARYVLSPFPIMLAFLSEAVHMNPAVVAHTVMPVFFLLLAYGVFGILGWKLFSKDKTAVGMFLVFLSLIHICSYYSVYTQGTFMLIRIWQGKALLAAVLLPALFYFCIRVLKEEGRKGDWLAVFAMMLACSLVSSMGIMLAPIMLGIMTLLFGIGKKQWKNTLYAGICAVPPLLLAGLYVLIR